MKTDFDMAKRIEYTSNGVIERGYKIYDEWSENRYSSRKIVKYVERAVDSVKTKGTSEACLEALSCLFALDIRIKEKYKTIFQCIFSYFSWCRERRALKLLMGAFNITYRYDDVRTLIEVELQGMRERLETEDEVEGDDRARGGKHKGKDEQDQAISEEKEQDQAENEKSEDLSEIEKAEESAEEKTEKISNPVESNEQIEEIKAEQIVEKAPSEDLKIAVQESKEQIREDDRKIKVESNGSDEISEPNEDKSDENKVYNDAIDSLPILEQLVDDEPLSDVKSFIDEVIIDNIVKGKKDIIGHNPLEDVKQARDVNHTQDTAARNNEQSKINDKNAFLYDKMVINDKGREPSAQKEGVAASRQDAKDSRVPLQVDITLDQENEMRREISSSMSVEAIQAIYEAQSASMREQLTIAGAELGIDVPVKIIGAQEPTQIDQPSAVPNRK